MLKIIKYIKYIIVLIFFISLHFKCFSFVSYDNVIPKDTLLNNLSKAKTTFDTINTYFELSLFYIKKDLRKSEYYSNLVISLSESIDYKEGIANGYFSKAKLFQNSHYKVSYNFAQKALSIYHDIGDKRQIANTLDLISIALINLDEKELALEYYNKILSISSEIGDSTIYAMALNNIGTYYSEIGNNNLAIGYYFKAADINIKTGNKNYLSINYGNISVLNLDLKDEKNARKYYYKCYKLKKEIGDKRGFSWLYNIYANIMILENKYDSALFYNIKSNKICKTFNRYNLQEYTLDNIQSLYFKMGEVDSAYKYLLELNELRDTINNVKIAKYVLLHEMDLKYNQERKLNELKHNNQIFKLALIILTLGLFIIITLIVIYVINNRKKNIKKQRDKSQTENEKLEQELNKKKQELATYVMNLANNNQMINKTIDKLNSEINLFAPKNHIIIKQIIKELKCGNNNNIWKEFEYRFNEIHPNFQDKLLSDFPDLTPNELKICLFLKMNMNSKEISQITYQSIASIEKARIRLRKKLNLTHKSISLVYFLSKY